MPLATAVEEIAELVNQNKVCKIFISILSSDSHKITDIHFQIIPPIDSVFSYSQVPEAYTKMRSGHLRGKIVISVNKKEPSPPNEDGASN